MKVIKNYLYNLSYQILTIILPIITVPYVTRIFTSEDLGNYVFYSSIVNENVLQIYGKSHKKEKEFCASCTKLWIDSV